MRISPALPGLAGGYNVPSDSLPTIRWGRRGRPVALIPFFCAVLLTSLAAGTVGAVLGLGGGMLLVPILSIFYGVDMHYAMGASIISVIATSSGAAASYLRTGLSNIRIGLFLAMATVTGALLGATLVGLVAPRVL